MTVTLRATASPGEVRVVAERDGAALDYALWRPGAPDGVGDLHRGRVRAVARAMAGAFVALDGSADGFLPDSEGGAGLREGDAVLVRIVRAGQGGKGPRLTARIEPPPSASLAGPPALLARGPDPLRRMAATWPEAPVLVDDAALAAELRGSLGARLRVEAAPIDAALVAELEALESLEIVVPGGGRMHIVPTPALVAIDLDLGAAAGARQDPAEAQAAANRTMLPALARQIRLRNLSGAILVDLAGLSLKRREALAPLIKQALRDDPVGCRLLGFTQLGFAELVRTRVHPPLHELLAGPHAAGLRGLARLAAELRASPARAPVLRAAPAVVAALEADGSALRDLARRAGRPLILRSDPALPPLAWRLDPD